MKNLGLSFKNSSIYQMFLGKDYIWKLRTLEKLIPVINPDRSNKK
jgi:hypothetical protein